MHRRLIAPAPPSPASYWVEARFPFFWLAAAPVGAVALCLKGAQDGGGRGGGTLPEQHEQKQGPFGAAHLCDQVWAARLRSAASRPAFRTDFGLYVGLVVLWGPSELGVVAGPGQLWGRLRAGVGPPLLCPHEPLSAVLRSSQSTPRVRRGYRGSLEGTQRMEYFFCE